MPSIQRCVYLFLGKTTYYCLIIAILTLTYTADTESNDYLLKVRRVVVLWHIHLVTISFCTYRILLPEMATVRCYRKPQHS